MNHPKIIFLSFMGMFCSLQAQQNNVDQLVLSNGETLAVNVKKVAPETITYSFEGENLENVVEKSDVAKIVFQNGREQVFSDIQSGNGTGIPTDFEYPTMKSNEGAVLPFEFFFDGEPSPEDGIEAQEYYYDNLMRRPDRNTISYQDAEITQQRLRAAGIREAADMRDYDMAEIAKIVGAGVLVTGKIQVDYRSTTSTSTGSTTTRVTKKKKLKTYTSDHNTSTDEFNTKVDFKIYDKNGEKLVDETRRPFLATTRDNYVSTLNYLMKRTPYYQKN